MRGFSPPPPHPSFKVGVVYRKYIKMRGSAPPPLQNGGSLAPPLPHFSVCAACGISTANFGHL